MILICLQKRAPPAVPFYAFLPPRSFRAVFPPRFPFPRYYRSVCRLCCSRLVWQRSRPDVMHFGALTAELIALRSPPVPDTHPQQCSLLSLLQNVDALKLMIFHQMPALTLAICSAFLGKEILNKTVSLDVDPLI